jgi:hypothetical protein
MIGVPESRKLANNLSLLPHSAYSAQNQVADIAGDSKASITQRRLGSASGHPGVLADRTYQEPAESFQATAVSNYFSIF